MNLTLHRAGLQRSGRQIVSPTSLTVTTGELTVIVGPNGAGKSSLLSLMTGDAYPDMGTVMMGNDRIQSLSIDALAHRRAVVTTPSQLAFDFTVRDVVSMGWLMGGRHPELSLAMNEALASCELEPLVDQPFRTLSSGERQRVEFARARLQLWRPHDDPMPRWMMLDEPTANLDVRHATMMLSALKQLALSGEGIIAVLHDLDLAVRFADCLILMASGTVVDIGSPAEVLSSKQLSVLYGTPIHVEHHRSLNRLVVIS